MTSAVKLSGTLTYLGESALQPSLSWTFFQVLNAWHVHLDHHHVSEEDFPKSQIWGMVEGNIGTRGSSWSLTEDSRKAPQSPNLPRLRFAVPQFIPILYIDVLGDVHTWCVMEIYSIYLNNSQVTSRQVSENHTKLADICLMAARVAKHLISAEWSCQKISSWLICVSFLKLFEEDNLINVLHLPKPI